MIIKVIYANDGLGLVDARDLEYLIQQHKILAFERSDGLVTIGRDPTRHQKVSMAVPERRTVIQHSA